MTVTVRFFVNVVQTFLHVGRQASEGRGNLPGDMSISVQNTGPIAPVRKLASYCFGNFGRDGHYRHNVLVHLPAVLSSTDQDNRRAKITRIANEAARVADGARRVAKDFQIILRTEIG